MPFVVAERVPWEKMCETLNLKFMAEVGTNQGLLPEHFLFLAQKIFNDNSLSIETFQHRSVSWSQFNKVIVLRTSCPQALHLFRVSPTSAQGLTAGVFTMPFHVHQEALSWQEIPSAQRMRFLASLRVWMRDPLSSLFTSDLDDSPRLCVNTAQNNFDPGGNNFYWKDQDEIPQGHTVVSATMY